MQVKEAVSSSYETASCFCRLHSCYGFTCGFEKKKIFTFA
jgi:hypothetical protein